MPYLGKPLRNSIKVVYISKSSVQKPLYDGVYVCGTDIQALPSASEVTQRHQPEETHFLNYNWRDCGVNNKAVLSVTLNMTEHRESPDKTSNKTLTKTTMDFCNNQQPLTIVLL